MIERGRQVLLTLPLDPVQQRVLDEVNVQIVCKDYVDECAARFNCLLILLTTFLRIRTDAGAQQFPYLADLAGRPAPGEVALQHDLRDFLNSALIQAKIEISNVSSGRTDVNIDDHGYRFVIECKQTLTAWTTATPDPFLVQTSSYQQTNVRLGVLAILDLSKREPGQPHLDTCFTVRTVASENDERTVVVMRVPGNKQTPSSASKKKRSGSKGM